MKTRTRKRPVSRHLTVAQVVTELRRQLKIANQSTVAAEKRVRQLQEEHGQLFVCSEASEERIEQLLFETTINEARIQGFAKSNKELFEELHKTQPQLRATRDLVTLLLATHQSGNGRAEIYSYISALARNGEVDMDEVFWKELDSAMTSAMTFGVRWEQRARTATASKPGGKKIHVAILRVEPSTPVQAILELDKQDTPPEGIVAILQNIFNISEVDAKAHLDAYRMGFGL